MGRDIDFKVAAAHGLAMVRSWLPEGRMEGHEYVVQNPKNPKHNLGNFKINLSTGAWSDFSTGDSGGDAVSLFAYLNDLGGDHPMLDAAKAILEGVGYDFTPGSNRPAPPLPPVPALEPEWVPILPVPDDAPAPDFNHYLHGDPSATWTYRDAAGKVLFYVCRYDPPGEHKQYSPVTFCQKEGKRPLWRFKKATDPQPLYGLDRLAAAQASGKPVRVVIVEGEKCADALQELFPEFVVMTWPGGAGAVKRAAWGLLDNIQVEIIWPDNDEPDPKTGKRAGFEAALYIQKTLGRGRPGGLPRILAVPEDKPRKWDAYDAVKKEGWGRKEAEAFMWPDAKVPAAAPPLPPRGAMADTSRYPFRALGHDHGRYFFLSGRSRDVIEISAGAMSKNMFLALAPLSWWEVEFPGSKGPSWLVAQDTLIGLCEKVGPYDPSRVRGRGAWFDRGRCVLHLGDRLVIDGESCNIDAIDTRYVYELMPSIGEYDAAPLSVEESSKLLDLMRRLSWEKFGYAYLAAGWCMTAPICGAMDWRPHLWLTGPAGSGKSWVQENILYPALGDAVIYLQGSSTEAGIRQTLTNDALPVIMDEAEGNEESQQERIQMVLTLLRESSSNGRARIAKGTPSGRASSYEIRSSFLLSSISVGTKHYADETRISVVTLKVNQAADRLEAFERLSNDALETLTPAYCSGLRARAIKMIPIIRENAKRFAAACSMRLGTQRSGDQFGHLLAGAFALENDHLAEPDEIRAWVQLLDQSRDDVQGAVMDEERCLQTIVQAPLDVDTDKGRKRLSVGELIAAIVERKSTGFSVEDADVSLRRVGIKVVLGKDKICFASSHEGLKSILRNTAWSTSYPRMLLRLPGAEALTPMRFTSATSCRAIGVPVAVVVPKADEVLL